MIPFSSYSFLKIFSEKSSIRSEAVQMHVHTWKGNCGCSTINMHDFHLFGSASNFRRVLCPDSYPKDVSPSYLTHH